jgi:hypothetical protein
MITAREGRSTTSPKVKTNRDRWRQARRTGLPAAANWGRGRDPGGVPGTHVPRGYEDPRGHQRGAMMRLKAAEAGAEGPARNRRRRAQWVGNPTAEKEGTRAEEQRGTHPWQAESLPEPPARGRRNRSREGAARKQPGAEPIAEGAAGDEGARHGSRRCPGVTPTTLTRCQREPQELWPWVRGRE